MPRSRESYALATQIGGLRTAALIVDLYVKVIKMQVQLADMDEKLAELSNHGTRLRVLESAKARLYGACVVLGVLVSGGSGWIALVLNGHH